MRSLLLLALMVLSGCTLLTEQHIKDANGHTLIIRDRATGHFFPPEEWARRKGELDSQKVELREHSTSDKWWLAGMIACQAADYLSTKRGVDSGRFEEGNPIYGDNLNAVLVGKLVTTGAMLGFAYFDPKRKSKYYKIGAAAGCIPAAWNTHLYYENE